MRVLLTGGAGFIGQRLARGLVAAGHDVTALDLLLPQVHPDPEAAAATFPGPVVVADVADPASWTSLAADAVVHLAAETGTGQSMYEPDRYTRVNVTGTALAGAAAREWGAALVSLSSRAVYGEGRYLCSDPATGHGTTYGGRCCGRGVPAASHEDDPHRPVSVYGRTKSEAESALAPVAGVVPVTVVRPQNVVGAGQSLTNPYTGVLAAFLAMLREGRPVTVYGDGRQTRDLVHVDDLVVLLLWALAHPAAPPRARVLNCGSGVRTTLTELVEQAAAGRPPAVREADGAPAVRHLDVHRAGDVEHACADLSRLREIGAPLPRWSTAEAVADFVRRSWDRPGAAASAWDDALRELTDRGLTR